MFKRILFFIYLLGGIAYPFYTHPMYISHILGNNLPSPRNINVPRFNIQHTMEPLDMNPITLDRENVSACAQTLSTSLSGTVCAAAGAYLFSLGIKHALCNDSIQSQSTSTSWIKNKYGQGLITSCIGAVVFLGGLYIIGNHEAVLNSIKK